MSKKRKRSKKDYDQNVAEQVRHSPKDTHPHLATEYLQTRGREEAEAICRGLLPAARDSVLGNHPGTTKIPSWVTGGVRKIA